MITWRLRQFIITFRTHKNVTRRLILPLVVLLVCQNSTYICTFRYYMTIEGNISLPIVTNV